MIGRVEQLDGQAAEHARSCAVRDAEVDRRERERAAMRVIPASREVAHKSIANLKRLLRGHA